MQKTIYPKLVIRSKNELVKHLSHKGHSYKKTLTLFNDCLENHGQHWEDHKDSDSEKEKYIRCAKWNTLRNLLDKINTAILARNDSRLPSFIFGGVKGKNHVKASQHLIGKRRMRTLLALDMKKFYEQIDSKRVEAFFERCQCSSSVARMLANICCVPTGPKSSPGNKKTIARGFSTSSRLAVWCNLNIFLKLERLVLKELKGHDPRIAIYVDDIGITASRVSPKQMEALQVKIINLFETADKNQPLVINEKKTKIIKHNEGMIFAGIELKRNKLRMGPKTRIKRAVLKEKLKNRNLKIEKRRALMRSKKGITHYERYVENLTK